MNLDDMDDFKDRINDSSDEGDMDREMVSRLHFGGFEEKTDRKKEIKAPVNKDRKSKKDIYEEIIKKSKLMKMEKQKVKEENQTKLEEIDNDFKDIAGLFEKKKYDY
jgi:nucleolar protein 14